VNGYAAAVLPRPGVGVFFNRRGAASNLVVPWIDGVVDEDDVAQIVDVVREGWGGPSTLSYDVIVVGGGAGIAAAVGAAAAAPRTALVERHGFPGHGDCRDGEHDLRSLPTQVTGHAEPLNEGFADTFARRLMGARLRPANSPRTTFVLPYAVCFARLADDRVADTGVRYFAYLARIETGGHRIDCTSTWERTIALTARTGSIRRATLSSRSTRARRQMTRK
jgi:hypothetical protein